MEQESEKNISETDLIDPQIEEIFSEIYNLPSDKSQILYLINKKELHILKSSQILVSTGVGMIWLFLLAGFHGSLSIIVYSIV